MLLLYVSFFFDVIFFVFSFVLFVKQSPFKKVNHYLALTFLLMAGCGSWLSFLNYAMLEQKLSLLVYYYPVSLVIVMFIGPSIYLYLKSLLRYEGGFKKWIHVVPSIPAFIFVIYFAIQSPSSRINWLIEDYQNVRWQEYFINILFYVQLIFYISLCLKMLNNQLKKSSFVEVGGKLANIIWLKYFFWLALSVFLINAIVSVLLNSDKVNTLLGLVLMDVLFIYFFFFSVWETGLLTHAYSEIPKNQLSTLKLDDQSVNISIETLNVIMQRDNIFLAEDITIDDVARKCNVSKHVLSHIINNKLNKNFNDFINEYRVQYACELLSDPAQKKITLEAIGLECGFGSKTSFNRAFKKVTGLTPSAYRQGDVSL